MSPPRWTAREWCHPALHTLDIIYSSVLAQSTLQATLHKAWIAPAECAIWSSSPVQLLPGIYLWQADYLPISPPRPCNVHTIFLLRQVLSRGVNNTGPYKYSFLGIFSNAIYFLSSRPSCPLLVFFFIWTSGLFAYLSFSLAWLDISQIWEFQLQRKKQVGSITSIFLGSLNFDGCFICCAVNKFQLWIFNGAR
jgi:hypothetical protein